MELVDEILVVAKKKAGDGAVAELAFVLRPEFVFGDGPLYQEALRQSVTALCLAVHMAVEDRNGKSIPTGNEVHWGC